MIKYTILYKNGKTWNGKATDLRNIPCVDCHVMVATYLYLTSSVRTDVLVPAELLPSCLGWVLKHVSTKKVEPKKVRQPNPKSKTKKQKALEDGYHRWIRDWHERGSSDITMQAYKKWLWEQKQTELRSVLKETSLGEFVEVNVSDDTSDGWITWNGGECPVPKGTMAHVKYRDGEEAICTVSLLDTDAGFKRIGEGGRVATNWYILPGFSFDEDIIAYKLYEEETSPNEPQKITFASGATISFEQPIETPVDIKINWEGVYKPWKESAIERLHKQVDEHWKFMDKVVGILGNKPIKTTYTFWLGAFGELVKDKGEIND